MNTNYETENLFNVNCQSDVGRRRPNNEDRCGYRINDTDKYLIAWVADGAGGHANGDKASGIIDNEFQDSDGHLAEMIKSANQRVMDEYPHSHSTATAVRINSDGHYEIAHVGDSRAYRINKDESGQYRIEQLTRDHNLGGKMSNVLTNSVGSDDMYVDEYPGTLNSGDYMLLCSDGLTGMVDDNKILDLVIGGERTAVDALVERANNNGGHDNISVVLIRYGQQNMDDMVTRELPKYTSQARGGNMMVFPLRRKRSSCGCLIATGLSLYLMGKLVTGMIDQKNHYSEEARQRNQQMTATLELGEKDTIYGHVVDELDLSQEYLGRRRTQEEELRVLKMTDEIMRKTGLDKASVKKIQPGEIINVPGKYDLNDDGKIGG
ncbi:MAG: serine/threonine-protein phosphatase [Candidatus Aenigmarchaeota archaeon]|nr:serine/threonine-protein phosphatase [Candidatus Aenigmarchaeota archaeon]